MSNQLRPVTIKRQRKSEAEKAIEDLEKRGYRVVFPLTEFSKEGKIFDRDSYNRRVFQGNITSSIWMAKLQKTIKGAN
jgi:hypothetical protein